jgi:hypothetical protein
MIIALHGDTICVKSAQPTSWALELPWLVQGINIATFGYGGRPGYLDQIGRIRVASRAIQLDLQHTKPL